MDQQEFPFTRKAPQTEKALLTMLNMALMRARCSAYEARHSALGNADTKDVLGSILEDLDCMENLIKIGKKIVHIEGTTLHAVSEEDVEQRLSSQALQRLPKMAESGDASLMEEQSGSPKDGSSSNQGGQRDTVSAVGKEEVEVE